MKTFASALVAAAALALPAAALPSGHTLVATVGPHDAFTITLTLDGKKVHTLPAGTYTFVVHDDSAIHNFALGSQTQSKRLFTTGIPFKGVKTYRVKLTAGSYAYACSAHFQTMNGHFTVR
jgi:plastocyanin